MTDKPRKHHFVPQFWIRRFAGADGKLWAYDHQTGRTSERSSKQLMQIFNLYTVQPSGADDTTLETVDLNKIDSRGSATFDRVLNGDHSQSAREEFASFLAAQVLRDPDVMTSYNPRAQELTLSLLEAFDAPDFDTFRQRWETRFPGTTVTEDEFKHIYSLGLQGAEDALEQIITALDATEGLPELPFTDAVRSSDGRDIVRTKLLNFDWTLKTDRSGHFVLGDTGVLYNKGHMQSLAVPLSRSAALYPTPSDHPKPGISSIVAADHDVENLNLESAARSRRWIVGDPSVLNRLSPQVGRNPLPGPNQQ
ncbi:DUF4238 domain-containing protein [Methylocystis sp. IM2]|uniref:DUF4238 domain-containing protein n=2 Tax=Methylocystis TaxID=133 RepID=UPI0030F95533